MAKVNAVRGGMAFQAMNHGLEARATSPLRIGGYPKNHGLKRRQWSVKPKICW